MFFWVLLRSTCQQLNFLRRGEKSHLTTKVSRKEGRRLDVEGIMTRPREKLWEGTVFPGWQNSAFPCACESGCQFGRVIQKVFPDATQKFFRIGN